MYSNCPRGVKRTMNRIAPLLLILLFVFLVCIDQYTKWLVLSSLAPFQVIPIIEGFFNLTLVFNTGVAFGMLSGLGEESRSLIVGGVTLVALLVVLTFVSRHYRQSSLALSSLVLILGGAVGNLIDRVRLGKVVDFLDIYVSDWHWPAFNAADSFICIGVVLLLLLPPPQKSQNS